MGVVSGRFERREKVAGWFLVYIYFFNKIRRNIEKLEK